MGEKLGMKTKVWCRRLHWLETYQKKIRSVLAMSSAKQT